MPVKVIADSNFLMLPSQRRIDIFRELYLSLNRSVQIIILSPVYDELRNISLTRHPKLRKQASLTLKMIEGLEIVNTKPNSKETVDDFIIRFAKESKYPVATNDKELRKKLRSNNIPVIYLRQGVRLEIEGQVL